MNLNAKAIAAIALAAAAPTSAQTWYPANYATAGAPQHCLNDGAHPVWMENQELLMPTAESCCARYYSHLVMPGCVAASTGVAYGGTNAYYPKYQESKCVKDCDPAGAGCGGILTDGSVPMYNSVAACCAGSLGHMDAALCAEFSVPSGGTNKYFPDAHRSICLKDCEPGASVGCTRITSPSAKLYPSLDTCCESMPWVSSEYCHSRSMEQRSGKWFADDGNHICRQDCETGATCEDLDDATETLYESSLQCCQEGLTWVPVDKCNTLSQGNPLTGSNKWFVSYEVGEERCFRECLPEGGSCGGLAHLDIELFDDAKTCCTNKLSYKSLSYCEVASTGSTYTGTSLYYVDYPNSRCVMDCDDAIADCGGIITDRSTELFNTVTECCDAKLPSLDQSLCLSRSNEASTGTGKYYSAPGSPVCLRDLGADQVENPSTPLYDTENECCSQAISWASLDFCTSRTNGQYSNKWYVADYSTQKCAKDCAAGGPSCVPGTDASATLYTTALECCQAKLGWLDAGECDAMSNDLTVEPSYTGKFYVAPGYNKW